jgi:hypothetical protein
MLALEAVHRSKVTITSGSRLWAVASTTAARSSLPSVSQLGIAPETSSQHSAPCGKATNYAPDKSAAHLLNTVKLGTIAPHQTTSVEPYTRPCRNFGCLVVARAPGCFVREQLASHVPRRLCSEVLATTSSAFVSRDLARRSSSNERVSPRPTVQQRSTSSGRSAKRATPGFWDNFRAFVTAGA